MPGRSSSTPCWRPRAGGALWAASPRELLPLLRRATLCTPNARRGGGADRAGRGDGRRRRAGRPAAGRDRRAARRSGQGRAPGAGRGPGRRPARDRGGRRAFSTPTSRGASPRGTGCALATALAVSSAPAVLLPAAVAGAGAWLAAQIAAASPSPASGSCPNARWTPAGASSSRIIGVRLVGSRPIGLVGSLSRTNACPETTLARPDAGRAADPVHAHPDDPLERLQIDQILDHPAAVPPVGEIFRRQLALSVRMASPGVSSRVLP